LEEGQYLERSASLELMLELKFGSAGLDLMPKLRLIKDLERLRLIRQSIKTVSTLEELWQMIPNPPEAEAPSANGA